MSEAKQYDKSYKGQAAKLAGQIGVKKASEEVLGINMEGQKEILDTWISENESTSFYASICAYLKNRGVKDI